ncbi:hypothetical protein CDAR_377351 [Caerostris darwini]|uniref:Uncharacterized protein n=1 Tax=Caerostris darwini TaxID=1538125 RepID=A0AAV4W004_9ARAC|nr:hypothetical protein CDAR_377351 [Caerostris darwini]
MLKSVISLYRSHKSDEKSQQDCCEGPLSGLGCIICVIRAAKTDGGSFGQEGQSACRTWIPCLVARGIRRRDAIAILWERQESGMTPKGREGDFGETRREIRVLLQARFSTGRETSV